MSTNARSALGNIIHVKIQLCRFRETQFYKSRKVRFDRMQQSGKVQQISLLNTMKRITMTLAVAAIFTLSVRGQGFQNLNFESAQNLPGNPPELGSPVSVANALPGWAAYDGSLALSEISYVSNFFGGASSSVELEGGSLALSGNNLSVGLYLNSSISQTGMVPGNAESLQFEARGVSGAAGFSVTLGGQKLSLSALFGGPDYIEYGANIPSALDGQMEALIFGCQGVGSGLVLLDDIEFSTLPIPEPSEYALLGLGAVLVGFCGRRKMKLARQS
jgi:hypothetical protein